MDADPTVLMVLSVVQMMGGESIQVSEEPLKTIKKHFKKAEEQELLQKKKITVPAVKKDGKPTTKKVDAYDLTDEGKKYLREAADPAVLAAVLNYGFVQELKEGIEADREKLRQEVQAALAPKKSKDDSKILKELEGLRKKVQDIAGKIEKLEKATEPQDDSPVMQQIEQGFDSITARLNQALAQLGTQATPTQDRNGSHVESSPPQEEMDVDADSSPEEAEQTSEVSKDQLEQAIKQAYEKLCLFVEYQDRLVEIPHLYDELVKLVPEISVDRFHQQLIDMWERSEIEFHILNEVRTAKEPDKAIRKNDTLYYNVLRK